ncbi:Plasmodium vivax Vir protein, putative [Plasmodium vivax]|uniref:Vir protein, putative n=1 Tax=Plasmodium vivax TaxID=5855 RepID=A0A1G4GSH8_PLAVI|nr:Plasmodium vivax Vir protein, putative [Plasmodium vivax]
MGSSKDDDYYDIVHLFPTGKDRFDISNISDNYEYLKLCNSFGPTDINEGLVFINPCMNVVSYIKDNYTKCPMKDERDCCKYLNYSINDVLKNNRSHHYNEETFIKAYNILVEELSKCINSIKVIDNNVFNNVKKLSNIYYKFNNHIKIINENQTTDCQHLSHIVQSYLNIKNTCKGDTNNFCDAVDKFKKDYLSKISHVKCKNAVYDLDSFLLLDHTKPLSFEEEAEEGQDKTKVVEGVGEGGIGTEEAARLRPVELLDVDKNGDPSNHNASNPVRTITYTSLGLVLPLATLYRLTPLGLWVNTKILGKNKLMDNMKKNHYELLLNDVRNGDMSLNDTTYSISYNSAAK